MINRVHADRRRAVVFGDRYSSAKAHFEPGSGASAAAEEVHDDFIVLLVEVKPVLGFEVTRVFLN